MSGSEGHKQAQRVTVAASGHKAQAVAKGMSRARGAKARPCANGESLTLPLETIQYYEQL